MYAGQYTNTTYILSELKFVSDRLTDCRSNACQFPELYNFGMSNIMLWGGMKIQTNQPLHEQISDPGFGHTKIWETASHLRHKTVLVWI